MFGVLELRLRKQRNIHSFGKALSFEMAPTFDEQMEIK